MELNETVAPVFSDAVGSDASRHHTALIDALATSAKPRYVPPRSQRLTEEVYRLSGSPRAAELLTHAGIGGSAARATRPKAAAQQEDSEEFQHFPNALPGRDKAAATDNLLKFRRRRSSHRLGDPGQNCNPMLANFWFYRANASNDTGVQYKPLEQQPASTAPLELLLPAQPSQSLKTLLEADVESWVATAVAAAVTLQDADIVSGQLCTNSACDSSAVHPEGSRQCRSCKSPALASVASLLPAQPPPVKPAAPQPPASAASQQQARPKSYDVQPCAIAASTQKLEVQETMLRQLLANDDAQWLLLLGDGKTEEFWLKVIDRLKASKRAVTVLGAMHSFQSLQKGVVWLARQLGGQKLFAATGWGTGPQRTLVSSLGALHGLLNPPLVLCCSCRTAPSCARLTTCARCCLEASSQRGPTCRWTVCWPASAAAATVSSAAGRSRRRLQRPRSPSLASWPRQRR